MNKKQQSKKFLQGLLRINKPEQTLELAVQQALSHIPSPAAYRLPEPNTRLLSSEKVMLTRKANQLFHLGQVEAAEKIYLTVGYSAGLHKLAEHYFQQNEYVRAYILFKAANDSPKAEVLTQGFVAVIQKWLRGD